mmetsp:Transcript_28825/g.82565  ORF Transcript_28825/g.82565 Transcript_28825/m.82565 type:complete len:212 (-) Transcript_28825:375-1010(-)
MAELSDPAVIVAGSHGGGPEQSEQGHLEGPGSRAEEARDAGPLLRILGAGRLQPGDRGLALAVGPGDRLQRLPSQRLPAGLVEVRGALGHGSPGQEQQRSRRGQRQQEDAPHALRAGQGHGDHHRQDVAGREEDVHEDHAGVPGRRRQVLRQERDGHREDAAGAHVGDDPQQKQRVEVPRRCRGHAADGRQRQRREEGGPAAKLVGQASEA